MQARFAAEDVSKATSHFALQEAEHTPDLLKRKSFASQFGDDCNLDYFFREINTLVAFVPGGNHLAFVPPLQLAQAHLCDAGDIRARKSASGLRQIRTNFACFEHKALLPFPLRTAVQIVPEPPSLSRGEEKRGANPSGRQPPPTNSTTSTWEFAPTIVASQSRLRTISLLSSTATRSCGRL